MAKLLGTIKEAAESRAVIECVACAELFDAVLIGDALCEVTAIDGATATVRAFDRLCGVGRSDAAYLLGRSAHAELGPGLLCKSFDALQRPLSGVASGRDRLHSLDRSVRWHFDAALKFGDRVSGGKVYGSVTETDGITHEICAPEGVSGGVVELRTGDYTLGERIGKIKRDDGTIEEITLAVKRDIKGGGKSERLPCGKRLCREDAPALYKGGSLCILGGSYDVRRELAEEIITGGGFEVAVCVRTCVNGRTYEGRICGIPAVTVVDLPSLTDAAYERSLDLAMTVAEYYRDMGYSVVVTVDDLSRIAEAMMREYTDGGTGALALGRSRLRASLLSWFERSGRVLCHGKTDASGDITVVCTASASNGGAREEDLRQSSAFWRLCDSTECGVIDQSESYSQKQT